jgi:hypothetical protein
MGKILIMLGLVLTSIGVLVLFSNKIPWLGRLPGDIYIEKNNFTFYFPITTSILLSIVLFIIMYVAGKVR